MLVGYTGRFPTCNAKLRVLPCLWHCHGIFKKKQSLIMINSHLISRRSLILESKEYFLLVLNFKRILAMVFFHFVNSWRFFFFTMHNGLI